MHKKRNLIFIRLTCFSMKKQTNFIWSHFPHQLLPQFLLCFFFASLLQNGFQNMCLYFLLCLGLPLPLTLEPVPIQHLPTPSFTAPKLFSTPRIPDWLREWVCDLHLKGFCSSFWASPTPSFSYCSWGSQGKNAEVICHSLFHGCERWTIKKAECQRINTFELGCWRRLLRVPWTARRSNQCILKEISPDYSLEGLMLKLKLQYFGHLMQRADSLEKTLMLGKTEGRKRRGQQMVDWHHQLNGHEFEQAPGDGEGQGGLACCSPWGHKESDTMEGLNNNHSFRELICILASRVLSVLPSPPSLLPGSLTNPSFSPQPCRRIPELSPWASFLPTVCP